MCIPYITVIFLIIKMYLVSCYLTIREFFSFQFIYFFLYVNTGGIVYLRSSMG